MDGSKNAVGGSTTNATAAGTDLSYQGPGAGRANSGSNGPSVGHQGLNAAIPGGMSARKAVSANVVRLGSGPGSVGGAAKNMGGINGTMVRPRRCPPAAASGVRL
jgi:hypothetical protein